MGQRPDRGPDQRPTEGPSLAYKATNFALFQVVYFACVLGAARGQLWLGPAAGLLLLPVNLGFVRRGSRAREVRLWLLAGAGGFLVDSCLTSAGFIGFPDVTRIAPKGSLTPFLVPPWIVTLWIAVGATLRSSLAWLRGRTVLACVLGAIGGPFSFWSGKRLGATELPMGILSVAALAIEYALLMPMLSWLAHSSEPESLSPDGGSSPALTSEPNGIP